MLPPLSFSFISHLTNRHTLKDRRSLKILVSCFQIPYVLSDDLTQNDRLTIAKAMDQIESDTCVKFVAAGLSPYYVHIGR